MILVTGGAGFIGTNLVERLLGAGQEVRILDSLSREGTAANLRGLEARHPSGLDVCVGDVREAGTVARCLRGVQHVVHLAAQVAVTSSLADPRHDFDVNAGGTLTLLEAIRAEPRSPSLVFCSTNKVYGALPELRLVAGARRYHPAAAELRRRGIDESRALDFNSPYGCSKGAADQYVLDYARSFGLRTVVMRMSCIYGPHQNGTEDQGWVAHFLRSALAGRPVRIYGDGRQVRDLLYVDDLLDGIERCRTRMERLQGRAFNVGGGPASTLSLLELLAAIERLSGTALPVEFGDWRIGDQKYYVSCTERFAELTGWAPRTGVGSGLARLWEWLKAQGEGAPAPIRRALAVRGAVEASP